MKVALILEQFSITRGGAERSTYELACALSELGVHVTLVAGQLSQSDTVQLPFTLTEVPRAKWPRLWRWHSFVHAVTNHIAHSDYDVVHSMVPLSCVDVYQPRAGSTLHDSRRHAASYNRKIIVCAKRATAPLNLARQARIAAERRLCQNPNGPVVAALSRYVLQQFQTDYHLHPSRLHLIPNGINVDSLRSEHAQNAGSNLRRLYDRNNQLTLFLFAAQNYRRKGLTWLINAAQQALSRLRPPQRDLRIMVVGSENYEKYWHQAQSTKDPHPHVLFMGSTQQMPALLQMCDAVVLPTYNDACSRLILEALAAGKPAITTRFNGAADFLGQGKYGIVIEQCNDVYALAQALLRLCDPQQQKTMAHAIQTDRLYQQVSIKRHAQQLVNLYEQIPHRRNNPLH